MKTLRDAKIGDTVKVQKLAGTGAIKRRLMDMGITKGVEIYLRKIQLELKETMALAGCKNIKDITRDMVVCDF